MTLTQAPNVSVPPAGGRWKSALLVGSLALNLLIVGAVLGGAWVAHSRKWQPLRGPNSPAAQASLGWGPLGKFLANMPPNRRADLQSEIAAYQAASGDMFKSLAGPRAEIGKSVTAESFDKSSFETALKAFFAAEAERKAATSGALASVLERMTKDERASFLRFAKFEAAANQAAPAAGAGEPAKTP